MKKYLFYIIAISFLAISFSSCNEENVPVTSTLVETPILLKAGNGAEIIKYDDNYAVAVTDIKDMLRCYIGVDRVEWCETGEMPEWDIFSFREIFLPNTDPARIIQKIKGEDVIASVWNAPIDCSEGPIAVGTVKFISNDNDLEMWARDSKNANSFGWRAHGKLTGSDGQMYNFNAVFRYVWKWAWDPSEDKITVQINLSKIGK